jgi:integrase
MAKPKKVIKVKEPVRIREKVMKDGGKSLYLDIYDNGVRKYEFLKLYIVPETSPICKMQNNQTRKLAEQIKAQRILALQSHGIKKWDKVRGSSLRLLDWLMKYENDSLGVTESTLKGRRDMRVKVQAFLEKEGREAMTMIEVDTDFCKDFLKFLRTAKHGVCKDGKTVISASTMHHHQAVLNGALNTAVREGIIDANPLKMLSRKEKFPAKEKEREFLTIEEVHKLIDTPCPNDNVKLAFLLSCFTGLRLSDVRALKWRDVQKTPDGSAQFIRIRMQKTQNLVNVPLSQEALRCMPPRELDEPMFVLPAGTSNICLILDKWVKAAGIDKHITYHCSRHSFATMLLTLNADIYTVSKLLGHGNINTTQIYAKIVDQKKVDTVNLIDTMFTQPNSDGKQDD